MTEFLDRRNIIAGGALAAASAFASQLAFADDKEQKAAEPETLPALADVIQQLKVPLDQLRPSGLFAPAGDPPVLLQPAAGADRLETVKTLPKVVGLRDGSNQLLTVALTWTCSTDKIHNLYLDASTPLVAKSITFAYTNISWQAGNGWPVYHARCPRDDYGQDMYYRHAKIHALVHSIGNTYSISCLQSGIFSVNDPAQVQAAVNDGPRDYGDNRGTFSITITSYS